MTVGEMLARISSRELTEWQILFSEGPLGEQRADIRSAIIACILVNTYRKKGAPAFEVQDYLDILDPRKKHMRPKQTMAQMKTILQGLVAKKK